VISRRILAVGLAVLVFAMAISLVYALDPIGAFAEYRGSDPFSNIAPPPQVGGDVNQYPLSAYGLDYHVDVSLTHPEGVPAEVAQAVAQFLWTITAWMVMAVIDILMFAFSLDLLNGSGGHGGALGPVSTSVANLYNSIIGNEWLRIAILVGSLSLIWEGLWHRRYADALGQLLATVCLIMVALTLIFQPQMTVGQVSQWIDTVALEILAGADGKVSSTTAEAKQAAANHLFDTFIVTPWRVLEFGGLKQCVDPNKTDKDGFPVSVAPYTSGAKCYSTDKYADRFLAHPLNSSERDAEYDALNKGEVPHDDPQFTGYHLEKGEAHAVDIQQQGGAWSRLGLSFLILIQTLGVVILFGALAVGIILSGIIALLLLGFAAFTILAACIPRWGHAAFRRWLGKMALAIAAKLGYSIIVAVLMALCIGLAAATATLGFLVSFGMQCAICWIAFAKRQQLFGWWGGADPNHTSFAARASRVLLYSELVKHVMGTDGQKSGSLADSKTENPYTQEPAPSPEERIPEEQRIPATDLRNAEPVEGYKAVANGAKANGQPPLQEWSWDPEPPPRDPQPTVAPVVQPPMKPIDPRVRTIIRAARKLGLNVPSAQDMEHAQEIARQRQLNQPLPEQEQTRVDDRVGWDGNPPENNES
jgi:hypothetical protein